MLLAVRSLGLVSLDQSPHPASPSSLPPSQNSHNGNKPSPPVAQSMKPVWINKGTRLYWCICGRLLTDTVWPRTVMLGTRILFPWLLMEFPNSSEWEWSVGKNRPPAVSVFVFFAYWYQYAGSVDARINLGSSMQVCVCVHAYSHARMHMSTHGYMYTLTHTCTCRHMVICRHTHAHRVEPRHIQKYQTDTFL